MQIPNQLTLKKVYGEAEKSVIRFRRLSQKYAETFGVSTMEFFTAPGRTEIIGNHLDHNGGKVLAASINMDTIGAAYPNESEMIENEYAMIMAIVNQGFSEEVMDAARPMGASGGTVFHSRRIGNEEAMKFWGIRIQEEREVVLILVKKENKLPIMQAICQQCGMQSEAHGIVFSLPVDGIIGLN